MRNVLERLINLLVMLLTSSRPVSADRIRQTIPGYSADSDEAFHRMFERDKDLLRSIGVPIELRSMDGWEVDQGYVVDPAKYRIADPKLTDEERAALFLAAQMVRIGGEPAAPEAILKLGGVRLTGAVEPFTADLGAAPGILGDLFQAISERRVITMTYRDKSRRVAPYGLGHRRGHWYLVGGTSEGQRTYRVDRMTDISLTDPSGAFRRPIEFDLSEVLASLPFEAGPDQENVEVTVEFSKDVAWWAARQLGATTARTEKDGRMVAKVPVTNRDAFVGWVLSFGEGAVVLSPHDIRQAVVDRVRGLT